jgi:hypothetical protein
MFAVYAKEANFNDPLTSVVVGERPEPVVPEGWVRVRVTHASLNRHDIFTLLGVTAQTELIPFPMILGNDGARLLDDGTPVVNRKRQLARRSDTRSGLACLQRARSGDDGRLCRGLQAQRDSIT